MDIDQQTAAIERTVSVRATGSGEETTVVVSRVYGTTAEDLWEACTSAERIPRWFMPVSGDLREGGTYQLEGNAGGRVLDCDPPRSFRASWEYGGEYSEITVSVTPVSEASARFELRHEAPMSEHWERYGPGATGIGWEMGLLGLTLHLGSGADQPVEATEWARSEEALRFMAASARLWGEAHGAAGADTATAKAAADRTLAAYTGQPEG
ncbi:SRPBCC domain-containing protein [Nocardiopsis sp. CNT312]|uniref:SRPBCC domain-containing protein n=1 Tax=Nocardiopsis sp. CNT312 TaxID=1137268 RepID=UPI0004914575|nr:SRPBCC domain-containing protein [Nocardiopsis sp. CNT312]